MTEPVVRPVAHKLRRSPNFDDRVIPVEFLVIHYTACDLERTLDILCNPERKASSHLVVDEGGEIFELVECLESSAGPKRAWHAGVSKLERDGKVWEGFNDFSIGIEVVNLNGNVFPFLGVQYEAIEHIIKYLAAKYPALKDPRRIVGHEEIAGFRGKVDPGHRFDWNRIAANCYPGEKVVPHSFALPAGCIEPLKLLVEQAPQVEGVERQNFFTAVSALCEAAVGGAGKL